MENEKEVKIEEQPEKLGFSESVDKIMEWFVEIKDGLKEDGIKHMRSEFKKVDKAYKESLKSKSEVIKDFWDTLKTTFEKEKVIKTLKKFKRIRVRSPIIIKEEAKE